MKLDGLKVTYTVDDDVFMGTGRDHWFAFSFIGRKIVFPYGMPGQNKMDGQNAGFRRPYGTGQRQHQHFGQLV